MDDIIYTHKDFQEVEQWVQTPGTGAPVTNYRWSEADAIAAKANRLLKARMPELLKPKPVPMVIYRDLAMALGAIRKAAEYLNDALEELAKFEELEKKV